MALILTATIKDVVEVTLRRHNHEGPIVTHCLFPIGDGYHTLSLGLIDTIIDPETGLYLHGCGIVLNTEITPHKKEAS
jgi:hypothetical protein